MRDAISLRPPGDRCVRFGRRLTSGTSCEATYMSPCRCSACLRALVVKIFYVASPRKPLADGPERFAQLDRRSDMPVAIENVEADFAVVRRIGVALDLWIFTVTVDLNQRLSGA